MSKFKFIETSIPDLYTIEPKVFSDQRGYFMESYNQNEYSNAGINVTFVQDNESKSKKGVLRGLHYQTKYTQGKLVRVIEGEIFDVAVDLRKGSPTYGQWEGVVLSAKNKKQLYIPEGFAHGFLVLSEEALFNYKCTNFFSPDFEGGILWNDPDINIEWPLDGIAEVQLSEKDQMQKHFKDQEIPFIYKEK